MKELSEVVNYMKIVKEKENEGLGNGKINFLTFIF